MKNLAKYFLIFVFTVLFLAKTPVVRADDDTAMKDAAANLCSVLKASDRDAFSKLLDASAQNEMQWWWDASGKGKYFNELFDHCAFDHIDPNSTADQKKVFIQRFNKGDGKPWGRPAPVVFKKDASGAWKITGYSL